MLVWAKLTLNHKYGLLFNLGGKVWSCSPNSQFTHVFLCCRRLICYIHPNCTHTFNLCHSSKNYFLSPLGLGEKKGNNYDVQVMKWKSYGKKNISGNSLLSLPPSSVSVPGVSPCTAAMSSSPHSLLNSAPGNNEHHEQYPCQCFVHYFVGSSLVSGQIKIVRSSRYFLERGGKG